MDNRFIKRSQSYDDVHSSYKNQGNRDGERDILRKMYKRQQEKLNPSSALEKRSLEQMLAGQSEQIEIDIDCLCVKLSNLSLGAGQSEQAEMDIDSSQTIPEREAREWLMDSSSSKTWEAFVNRPADHRDIPEAQFTRQGMKSSYEAEAAYRWQGVSRRDLREILREILPQETEIYHMLWPKSYTNCKEDREKKFEEGDKTHHQLMDLLNKKNKLEKMISQCNDIEDNIKSVRDLKNLSAKGRENLLILNPKDFRLDLEDFKLRIDLESHKVAEDLNNITNKCNSGEIEQEIKQEIKQRVDELPDEVKDYFQAAEVINRTFTEFEENRRAYIGRLRDARGTDCETILRNIKDCYHKHIEDMQDNHLQALSNVWKWIQKRGERDQDSCSERIGVINRYKSNIVESEKQLQGFIDHIHQIPKFGTMLVGFINGTLGDTGPNASGIRAGAYIRDVFRIIIERTPQAIKIHFDSAR